MSDVIKVGEGYIVASAIEAILPDEGVKVDGLTVVREPNPNLCTIFTSGGHKLMLGMSAEQAMRRVDACHKPEPALPAFLEVEGSPEEALQLLAWLHDRRDLELTYSYDLEPHHIPAPLHKPGPIPEEGWTVHQRSGSVNDKEWTMVALEGSPIEALRTAHQAFCDGR